MMLLNDGNPTSINQKKETEPTLSRHRIFNWFDNLPKICQELFTDAVQISDKKKTIFGKLDHILGAIHTVPNCTLAQKEFAQFFTPSDVALYSAFSLLDNYNMESIFDPCVGHGSLLIATALVLAEKEKLSGWDLVRKLHGSEIDRDTRMTAIKNIARCLVDISPSLEINRVEAQLQKQIGLCDFITYPNNKLFWFKIIVNPPYKEGNKGNAWIPIIAKLINCDIASISLIGPVSISSSKRTQFIRSKIFDKFKTILAFHHEIRPRPLFHGVEQRISIITATRDLAMPYQYMTTGFFKASCW